MTDRNPAPAHDTDQPTPPTPDPQTEQTPASTPHPTLSSASGTAPDEATPSMADTSSPDTPLSSDTSLSAVEPAAGPASDPGSSAVGSWPDPDGEVVPGDPPVPITLWHLSRPAAGTVVSVPMVRRLTANYTRPGAVVVDLSTGTRLERPVPTGRRHASLIITGWPPHHPHDRPHPDDRTNPDDRLGDREQGDDALAAHLEVCAGHLAVGGCLAVVLSVHQTPDLLGVMVGAARQVGLTYLQHIVVAHQLTTGTPAGHDPGHRSHRTVQRRVRNHRRSDTHPDRPSVTGPDSRPDAASNGRPDATSDSREALRPDSELGRVRDARHLKVHTDLLIFRRPEDPRGSGELKGPQRDTPRWRGPASGAGAHARRRRT